MPHFGWCIGKHLSGKVLGTPVGGRGGPYGP